jgi:hypothetical protein
VVAGDDIVREIRDEGGECEQVLAERRVHLQDPHLSLAQRAAFEKDRGRNSDLADVVQQEAVPKVRFRGELGVYRPCQCEREAGDAPRMLACLVVAQLESGGERLDDVVVAAVPRLQEGAIEV